MYYLNTFIFVLIVLLSSCAETVQNNGLSQKSFENIKIEIGKTSKKDLIKLYGPPNFEGVFNKDKIYYVSHKTGYKLLKKSKTKNLHVYEIILDEQNFVKNFKKFSEKDSLDIEISDKKSDSNKGINYLSFWKEIINNLRRNNLKD